VVGLPKNSYKPITNAAWVRAQLCKLQKRVVTSSDWFFDLILIFGVLKPLSAIFQLYHGDQLWWWKKPEYPERTTGHGQATGKPYHCNMKRTCKILL
jgi:hypothetical protein